MPEFQLKTKDGRVVTWEGKDGEDAARRFADTFRGEVVIAWRWPKAELRIGLPRKGIGDAA